MKIRSKITAALMLTAVLVAVPLMVVFVLQRRQLSGQVAADGREQMVLRVSGAAQMLGRLSATQETLRRELLGSALRMIHDLLGRTGPTRLGKSQVVWTATDRADKSQKTLLLPAFTIGGQAVKPNDGSDVGTLLVDQAEQMAGTSATIFQRMNPEGDMLQIATTLREKDGSRAVGTTMPKESPVVQGVLRGQSFQGRGLVVDEWFLTAYEPIRGAGDEIIGMLFVGLPENKVLADLMTALGDTMIGKDGYPFVLGARDEERGKFIHHPNPRFQGKSAFDMVDIAGRSLVSRFIDDTIKAEGKPVTFFYPWTDESGKRRNKIVSAIYFKPWQWILAASSYEDDFLGPAKKIEAQLGWTQKLFVGITLLAMAVTILLAWLFSRAMTRPLRSAFDSLHRMAAGDLSQSVAVSARDEVGRMAEALNGMRGQLSHSMLQIGTHAQSVAASSEQLATTSRGMRSNAELTSEQARVVTDASTQVSISIQTVATGTEQISSAVREISKSASESAHVVSNAVEIAKTTDATIGKLSASSEAIGKVVNVITSIAEQTNLLALNATIEAAHAGDAGKGFAVVASEVRDLAKETARATQEISRQVNAIQVDARGAVDAIGQIRTVIQQIYDLSGLIASAVEQQAATTNEISKSIAEAARGSNEITQSIQQVAETARGTLNGADHSSTAAGDLARAAVELQRLVGRFQLDERDAMATAAGSSSQLPVPRHGRDGGRDGAAAHSMS